MEKNILFPKVKANFIKRIASLFIFIISRKPLEFPLSYPPILIIWSSNTSFNRSDTSGTSGTTGIPMDPYVKRVPPHASLNGKIKNFAEIL